MRIDYREVVLVAKFVLWALWPLSVSAATITFGERLSDIPPLAILMTALLSTLSGVTALLHAMKQEYEKTGEIERLWLFIASKMLGSNLAGLLMFFVAENYEMPEALQAAAIILAAFGGTWAIERAVRHVADKYLPEVKP